jgi:hypothetical protein
LKPANEQAKIKEQQGGLATYKKKPEKKQKLEIKNKTQSTKPLSVSQKKTDVESDTQIESEQTNKLSLHSYLKQKLEQKTKK